MAERERYTETRYTGVEREMAFSELPEPTGEKIMLRGTARVNHSPVPRSTLP